MTFVSYFYLAIAIVLEVTANAFLKRSSGMTHKLPGALGLLLIFASFTALSRALNGMDMATAYAIWGGCGILLTAITGWIIFRHSPDRKECVGLLMIAAGMILLELG
ncbi:DMT family transporter [[Erwinia] mediterraneensis]|uniref:DMT family transporter n=1 Tax=[Erwinia] mediterraneensis TaxID=2161819 RepID=UPI0010304557|nr:SMR family transporter [[Erwinia] mediterraneensis]